MNSSLTFFIAALSGILGVLGAGAVATSYADWYHLPKGDIGAGFLMAAIALLGGIVAFGIGLGVARVVGPGFWKALGCSSGLVLGIAGVVAWVFYLRADFPPTIDGRELALELEFKLPAGHALPSEEPQFSLATAAAHTRFVAEEGRLKLSEARREGERWIIPADASLFTSRGSLTASATLGSDGTLSFPVPLPAHPGKTDEQWSEWLPQRRAGDSSLPDPKSFFRFRVRRIPPP